MKNLIRLTDFTKKDIENIFHIADEIKQEKYEHIFDRKSIILFCLFINIVYHCTRFFPLPNK